jgi:hypothetical protein
MEDSSIKSVKISQKILKINFKLSAIVVYLEVGQMWRSLLNDGEWEYYIKESGFKECSCNMRYVVDNSSNVKHKVYLEIKN